MSKRVTFHWLEIKTIEVSDEVPTDSYPNMIKYLKENNPLVFSKSFLSSLEGPDLVIASVDMMCEECQHMVDYGNLDKLGLICGKCGRSRVVIEKEQNNTFLQQARKAINNKSKRG